MSKIFEAALGKNLSKRLRAFVQRVQSENARSARQARAVAERIDDLEADLGFLAMIQVAMLRLLNDKGVMKEADLVPRLAMADRLDGVEDGALSLDAFRGVIGLLRRKGRKAAKPASSNGPKRARAKAKR